MIFHLANIYIYIYI